MYLSKILSNWLSFSARKSQKASSILVFLILLICKLYYNYPLHMKKFLIHLFSFFKHNILLYFVFVPSTLCIFCQLVTSVELKRRYIILNSFSRIIKNSYSMTNVLLRDEKACQRRIYKCFDSFKSSDSYKKLSQVADVV